MLYSPQFLLWTIFLHVSSSQTHGRRHTDEKNKNHIDYQVCYPVPTFEYKMDFIKQNNATFYLWDPQDDKSEQDY